MFNAYSQQLSDLVQDFINSYDTLLEEPEHLQSVSDLEAFLKQHHIRVAYPLDESDLEAVRELREKMRSIWNAANLEIMSEALNPLLAKGRLSLRGDEKMNWRFGLEAAMPLVDGMSVAAALGIVLTVQEYGYERLRACESSPCQDVFVDTSRNKLRRFCSERCANRYNVAAFRGRNKEGES
jgi:predicted RNA-binding Zn ribbon-like protein